MVRDSAGRGLAGAELDPHPLDGQAWADREMLFRTGPDGAFQLPLPAGRWRLAVSAPGYVSVGRIVEVAPAGAGGTRVEIVLRAASSG